MAARIEQELQGQVALIESSGGVFEVTVDGELLYSKRRTGAFPEERVLLRQLRERSS